VLTGLAIVIRAATVITLSLIANRQSPRGGWTLTGVTAVAMSASAPLILVCAIHLYVLAAEHAAATVQHMGKNRGEERPRDGDA
jgi:hypothetical protein